MNSRQRFLCGYFIISIAYFIGIIFKTVTEDIDIDNTSDFVKQELNRVFVS